MIPVIPDEVIRIIIGRSRTGISSGRDHLQHERAYYQRCTHFHWKTGTLIIFTRDSGHHSSGWMKSPDFERCRHLSLSFRAPFPERDPTSLANIFTLSALLRNAERVMPLAPFNTALAAEWVKLIHGDDRRWSWEEGPFSNEGKELGVRHWRVFCDPVWQAIKPRGEVYSKDLTEKGWRSWSEVQGEDAAPNWVNAE
jgi:hypothetical protein